jgi:acetoacetate decarboxylase
MNYPPAPWNLYGNALQSFHLVDVEKAKAFVPADLEIVSMLPGKTVGCLYLSIYNAQSTLQYHELIVVPALVRYRDKIGAWISHIYVDHLESVAGGRNIWGLPKEMADFTWSDRNIKVAHGHNALCQFQWEALEIPLSLWGKSKVSVNVFGGLTEDILVFPGEAETWLQWVQCRLTIPAESPFAAIQLGYPWFAVRFHDLHLKAHIPSVAGQWLSK